MKFIQMKSAKLRQPLLTSCFIVLFLTALPAWAQPELIVVHNSSELIDSQLVSFENDVEYQSSAELSFTISNSGDQNLVFNSISIQPNVGNFDKFSISQPPLLGPGNTLSPDTAAAFKVRLTADSSVAGMDVTATVIINSNDPAFPEFQIRLIATVTKPELQVQLSNDNTIVTSGQTFDFGAVNMGLFEFMLKNIGNQTLQFALSDPVKITSYSPAFSTNQFIVSKPRSDTLPPDPDIETSLLVYLAPDGNVAGPVEATVAINSDDPMTPQFIIKFTGVIVGPLPEPIFSNHFEN